MRPHLRKLAAASATAYLLAGWLGAALHSHAPHGHGARASAVGAENCTTCSCGHHHGPAEAEQGHEPPASPEDGHDHCHVCDLLAKPPLAVAAVSLIEGVEPAVAAAEPLAPAFTPVAAFVSRSRGPPVA